MSDLDKAIAAARDAAARAIYVHTLKSSEHTPAWGTRTEKEKAFFLECADAALTAARRAAPCPCKLPTCVEPWEPGCGLGTSAEHAVAAPQPQAGAEDLDALDFAREASRLLYGFMLDVNAIGQHGAGENLVRGIKESRRAQLTKEAQP